ncbi:hypothetical protein RB620_23990 [Paenibacillus sp. LHD-117]|uniref:hypothetical protein n=1 Tax=Paenibacillus sp. LHD-117 TaxID=3071412 RepID=UPI0027DECF25|nr:hypothetical protein [Paenibacillus sp. LHD-117]MDQ6422497.1 hypothetical protein [Paenibacillus sp. LHD-117]
MEMRNLLFDELQQMKPTHEQRATLKPLVDHIQIQDHVIVSRMVQLYEDANVELNKINRGKRSKTMYESAAYGEDSLFFDAKR